MQKRKYTEDDCFRIWCNLGEERSMEEVASITGKSPKTIYNYSSSGKWKARLEELSQKDKEVIEAIVRDSDTKRVLTEMEVYRGLSESLLQTITDSLPLLQPTASARELKTLLDTYRLINGQPTDITKTEVAQVSTENLSTPELTSLAADVAERLFN
ncbi:MULTISPECIES: hypothetical protein [Deinococcus]|uniref:Uncharacterized protein n=1 Tax=Deinococcus rufus TaxID=2136097 RepID=A0ABV7ZAF2_9DEIO|nr:hypothetical protein [Deinococcus sp. AB2017081]WQE94421.1 hypothetical protein U2P90_13530 [Deinococcus sp. AB2017081]